MSLVLLSWAGQSFASGIVGAAGGMAFTNFLEAVGVPNLSRQTLARLEDISTTLGGVAREVSEINQRVRALATQLHVSHLLLASGAQESKMFGAIAKIRTHYGRKQPKARAKGKAPVRHDREILSLSDWVTRRLQGGKLSKRTIARFLRNITGAWNIPTSNTEISDGLVGTEIDDGALRAWTKLSIAQMVPGTLHPNLLQFYEILEQRFLYAVGVQMQGVYLVLLTQIYGSEPKDTRRIARSFLKDYAEGTLRPQVDRFLECVEKMVLSQGQWRSPWPIVDDVMRSEGGRYVLQGGMGVPADSGKILLRSEVICRRLMETFRDMRKVPAAEARRDEVQRSSGIYVHKLVPNKSIVDGEGPELAPWTDGGSKGRVLAASGELVPTWSGASGGYAQLSPWEPSQLRIVRYFWPYTEVRGPATPDFANGKRYYEHKVDEEELRTSGIDWPGLAVFHAYDLTALTAPIEGIDPVKGAWTFSRVYGLNRYTHGEFQSERMELPVMSPDKSRADRRAWLKLTGTQKKQGNGVLPGRTHFADVPTSCPLFVYDHPVRGSLRVHLWLIMSATRSAGWRGSKIHGRIFVRLKTPQGDLQLFDSNTSNGGILNLWDRSERTGGRPSASLETTLTEVITVGATGAKELYELEIHLQFAHQGWNPTASADIECVVKEVSISWAQPTQ